MGLGYENLDRYLPNYTLIAATFKFSPSTASQASWQTSKKKLETCVTCLGKRTKINFQSLKNYEIWYFWCLEDKKLQNCVTVSTFHFKKFILKTLNISFSLDMSVNASDIVKRSCILSSKEDLHVCLFNFRKYFRFFFCRWARIPDKAGKKK